MNGYHRIGPLLVALSWVIVATARAQEDEPIGLLSLIETAWQDADESARPVRTPFSSGAWTLDVFGGGATSLVGDEIDGFFSGGIGASYYLLDGVAVRGELIGAGFDQDGNDAAAAGFNLLARAHYLRRDDWSLFAEAGAGILLSDPSVPDGDRRRNDDGTHLNFTPTVGLGATYRLGTNTHLVATVRYVHISNAGIDGASRNPSFDGIGAWIGLMWHF